MEKKELAKQKIKNQKVTLEIATHLQPIRGGVPLSNRKSIGKKENTLTVGLPKEYRYSSVRINDQIPPNILLGKVLFARKRNVKMFRWS